MPGPDIPSTISWGPPRHRELEEVDLIPPQDVFFNGTCPDHLRRNRSLDPFSIEVDRFFWRGIFGQAKGQGEPGIACYPGAKKSHAGGVSLYILEQQGRPFRPHV